MCILNGEITVKEVEEQYHIDKETIRSKINEYGQLNFKGIIIYMIKEGLSQSEVARKFNISHEVISKEVEKLRKSEDPKDIKLYEIAKAYAVKKMKKIPLTSSEILLYTSLLDEMFGEIPVIDISEKSKKDLEIERLEEFMRQVQLFSAQGLTAEQVAKQMHTSIKTIRRNKLKLEKLNNIRRNRREISQEEFEQSIQKVIDGECTRFDLQKRYHMDRITLNNKIQELYVYNIELYMAFIRKFPYKPREYTHIDYRAMIIDIMRKGYNKKQAAEQYGIHDRTIARKIYLVEQTDPELVNLYRQVAKYRKKQQPLPK